MRLANLRNFNRISDVAFAGSTGEADEALDRSLVFWRSGFDHHPTAVAIGRLSGSLTRVFILPSIRALAATALRFGAIHDVKARCRRNDSGFQVSQAAEPPQMTVAFNWCSNASPSFQIEKHPSSNDVASVQDGKS